MTPHSARLPIHYIPNGSLARVHHNFKITTNTTTYHEIY